MATTVPAGSDVSADAYRCMNCGNEIQMNSKTHFASCPKCGNGVWDTVSGSDSVNDRSERPIDPLSLDAPNLGESRG
jgi:predicted  nucleic acid-binding Zn-ribbon protein